MRNSLFDLAYNDFMTMLLKELTVCPMSLAMLLYRDKLNKIGCHFLDILYNVRTLNVQIDVNTFEIALLLLLCFPIKVNTEHCFKFTVSKKTKKMKKIMPN